MSLDLSTIANAFADRYSIERELGRGGMGAVYLARDLKLDRHVALKVLPPEFAEHPDLRERFLRETRTAASFSHPNIVPVHAVEDRETLLAYAMGLVEGESVAERVTRMGPLGVREIVRMLEDIGYALAYAHGRGVVHRDIKPDNIMLERATGRALLMDFGISRSVVTQAAAAGLTRVGEVVGTPEYMSPEQAAGDTVDGRSDLYSLGLVAWFAATGRTAMTGETTQKVIVKQLTEAVPRVESIRSELPDLLSAAIDKCVEKAPEARFQSAQELVEAVENSKLAGPEIPLPIRTFLSELETLGLVLVFITVSGWFVYRSIAAKGWLLDALIPVVVLFSIAVTRVLQAVNEARGLAQAGFGPNNIALGIDNVYRERESVRQARRLHQPTVARRRKTLRAAIRQLAIAIACVGVAYATRRQIAPGTYSTSTLGITLLFSGVAFFGVSLVLLLRSPFRAPLIERLQRRVWTGAPGRLLLRLTGGRVIEAVPAPPATSRGNITAPRLPHAVTKASGGQPSLLDLTRRVEALEAWRQEKR